MRINKAGILGVLVGAMLTAACNGEGGAAGPNVLNERTFLPALAAAARPCDQANERFSSFAQQEHPDIAAASAAGTAGGQTCAVAARQIEVLPVSEPLLPVRALCAEAYVAKGGMLEHAGKLDYTVEDPSGLEELKRRALDAESKIQACLRGAGVQNPG